MDYFDRIAGEWYERASDLADWVMSHLEAVSKRVYQVVSRLAQRMAAASS